MNAENVGYRYSDDEMAALMLILSLKTPPGASQHVLDQAAYDRAFDALTTAQIITPAGDEAYIDPLTTMLLSEISDSPRCLRIISESRSTTLYSSLRLIIADEHFSGTHTLVPLPDIAEASAYLSETLSRHSLPADVLVSTDTGTGELSETAVDADTLLRTATMYLSEI